MRLIDADKVIEKLEAFVELSDFGLDELIEVGRFIEFIKKEPDVKERWALTIPASSSVLTSDTEWDIPGKRPSCIEKQMEWEFDDENN